MELEALLNDPEFHSNRFPEVADTLKQLEEKKAHAAALYARWEALEALDQASQAPTP
jgi:hypothetical protein